MRNQVWEALQEVCADRERLLQEIAQLRQEALQYQAEIQYLHRVVDEAAKLGEPFMKVCFEGGVDDGTE